VALTRQLLGFSRPMALDVRVLDTNEVVASLVSLFTRLLREDVALEVDTASEPAWIRADQHLLEQVLMNLIVNARDALPLGGHVGVRVLASVPEGGSVDGAGDSSLRHVIEVWDDGEGVPAALQEKIFEPFFTTKPPGIGTGLGLSTVRSIVRHAGGEISVRPREPRGTVFSVSLPVAEAAASPSRRRRKGGLLPEGSETVLVVEDDAAILQATSMILNRQGYSVLQAQSGAEARSQIAAYDGRVDLVVADVLLPDGPGPTLVESLSDEPRGVLFLTGSTSTPIVSSVERLGATVLSKPVDPERLIVEVRRELDRSARRQGVK
jgi:CheY-like chemotaxis protein